MATKVFDKVILDSVCDSERKVSKILECDVLYYYGELRTGAVPLFRDVIEDLVSKDEKRGTIAICLTTPGGQAEAVEKMVEIIRHHYERFFAIVPRTAMSAGTIFCMAADEIWMDYASALGPIDPQVPDRDDKFLVPALGYLDKVAELIEKSKDNKISPAEFQILQNQDLAMLRFYEQAKQLSISLLEKWLAEYKFRNWTVHRSTNAGAAVTENEKRIRAKEIATKLSDNKLWHSHGRMIGMKTLQDVLKLEIKDYGDDDSLRDAIRKYSDTLTGYIESRGNTFQIFSSKIR